MQFRGTANGASPSFDKNSQASESCGLCYGPTCLSRPNQYTDLQLENPKSCPVGPELYERSCAPGKDDQTEFDEFRKPCQGRKPRLSRRALDVSRLTHTPLEKRAIGAQEEEKTVPI
ncbi:hypothetical protein LMH87_000389 [Akanthomyces muscarius]|uniref:Uncharacterized protein n=1 Tax=Akanthomyces muscarius TaxID=2231603 RepID=A0A9W8QEX6_AKAMU|nr:hypothetical protein LMH87_000389 [Akanthomyces muscarius]KAJ4155125.1 hypothetical protein LMH87_000389 [Akanthomyces muscarius]